ncbi:MAG: DUF2934 domain-containing protein [Candidatus Hermodarchaeota archaeon]
MVTEDEVKKLARVFWEIEGCPEGRDLDHYFRAKRLLEEKERVALNMARLARVMDRSRGEVSNLRQEEQ